MNGPGRSHRKGVSLIELAKWLPDEAAAVKWLPDEAAAVKWSESVIWPDGRKCPRCDGENTYKTKNDNGMPYRCRACKRYFSVKAGTALQSSKIPLQKWVWTIFLDTTLGLLRLLYSARNPMCRILWQ